MSKRIRMTNELPDDVGTVFLTDVPNAPFLILGRRDPTSGELFVGTRFAAKPDVNIADLVAEIEKEEGAGVEIVAGEEAEQLIRRIQLEDTRLKTDHPVMPAFVFWRRRDIELEAGFILAGQLIVDLPNEGEVTQHEQEMVSAIVQQLTAAAQSGELSDANDLVVGWRSPDGCPPENAADIDDDALMSSWAKDRLAITVRVDPRDDGLLRVDSDMRRQLDLPRDEEETK
jgi:hypothetical protein